jgi:hypothetical protein
MAGDSDSDDLGGSFWLMLIGVAVAIGIGALILFWLIGSAWASWGGLGALVVIGAVALLFGFFYDRRQAKLYSE